MGPKDAFTTLCPHMVAQSFAFMFVTISVTALTSLEWAAREIFWPPSTRRACPLGECISRGEPIGPFNFYSNEDHWVERPIAPGVVLIGDAPGHNDPLIGQGPSIVLRDVRVVRDIIPALDWRQPAFEFYVEERSEKMRRLRITGRFLAIMRVQFGAAAAARRARALRRNREEGWLSPLGAGIVGPETLPTAAFEEATINAVLAED